MATCQEVITRAYRLPNWRGVGQDPTATESEFAMVTLQGVFDHWVASGLFGRLTDKLVSEDYTAKEQERIVVSGSPTITIPDSYSCDGDVGSDRPPYDLSLIEVVDGATRNVWLYDRTGWVDLIGLTLTDECPLSTRGMDGLAAVVATQLTGTTGTIHPSVVSRAQMFTAQLSYKTGSQRAPRTAEFF